MPTASASHSFTSSEDALGAAATNPIAMSSAQMPACKLRNAWASSRKRSTASASQRLICACAARAILLEFQSGMPELRIADLNDVALIEHTRTIAGKLWDHDPYLRKPEHAPLREKMLLFWQNFMAH